MPETAAPTDQEATPTYLLFTVVDPGVWAVPAVRNLRDAPPPAEQRRQLLGYLDLMEEAQQTGELLAAYPLSDPRQARVLRIRGDQAATTTEPFPDGELFSGVFVFRTHRIDEIAERFPAARNNKVVVVRLQDRSLADIMAAAREQAEALGPQS